MKNLIVTLLYFALTYTASYAQNTTDSVMITVFLKHQQDKSLKEMPINFMKCFRPNLHVWFPGT
jgi:hypothetical protein